IQRTDCAFQIDELLEFCLGWQLAVPPQQGNFLEGFLAGQVLNGIAAVEQRVSVWVDFRDSGGIGDNADQAFSHLFGHEYSNQRFSALASISRPGTSKLKIPESNAL